MKPPRKLHIKSYGCQMNVYDAQRMVDTLENHTVDFRNSPGAKTLGEAIRPFIADRQPLFHFTPVA